MSHTPSHGKHPTQSSLPRPPSSGFVDAGYMSALVRALELALDDITDISPLRGASLYLALSSMPTNGNMLRPGTVFIDNGHLVVALENYAYAPSLVALGSVGTVTVST